MVAFTLDSTTAFPEAANTCTGTVNGGALYYNSAQSSGTQGGSDAIRACINGNWDDVVTTSGLGLLAFGVVSNSGGAGAGDLPSLITPGVSGPCKVSWASTTTVTVAPCIAYSGGRKVIVSSTTLTLSTTTLLPYENVCLTGTNSAPAVVGPAGTQTSAGIEPAFIANSPILCLATLKNSSTVNGNFTGTVQGQIYDTRTFTDTTKEYETSAAVLGMGYIAQASTTGVTIATLTAGQGLQRGVVVATAATISATNPNVIIATAGPAYVVATAGAAAGVQVETGGTTASFAITGASGNNYGSLGISRTAFAAGCTSAATCAGSLYVDLMLR